MLHSSLVRTQQLAVKSGLCRKSKCLLTCRAVSTPGREVDFAEIGKYVGSTAAQVAIVSAVTFALDKVKDF